MSEFDRKLESLSAYLDGELAGDDRAQIERLLQEDLELQGWFEELKGARTVLRKTPKLRAPRNFYITPEMVGQNAGTVRAFPILRFASAFAAFLLVLIFLGDLFVIPRFVTAPASSIQIAEFVLEEEESAALEAEVFPSQPPSAAAEPLMQEMPAEGEPAPESMQDENISSGMENTPQFEKVHPTQLPAPLEELEERLGTASDTGEALLFDSESREPEEVFAPESQPGVNFITLIRLTEVALLIIAVSAGCAALILHLRK